MACHAVQMWSLSGLVAAFLDLTIAYLLLCGSAVAYFASKFLGFFGLGLPCPCNGMFMNVHSRSLCLNRLLVDFPIQKLSDVNLSVRQKFPFSNSLSPKQCDSSVVGDHCTTYGIVELDGEASCSSSISDARGSTDLVRRESSLRAGKIDMKGKGVLCIRPRSRLRRRRGSHGKSSSLFSYDSPLRDEVIDEQHFSRNKRGSWYIGDGLPSVDNAGNHSPEYDKAPKKQRARLRSLSRDKLNLLPDEDTHMKKSTLSGDELQDNQEIQVCGGDEKSKIKHLEQALEKERAARAALCIDLEEERSAAASAADEAMAMILRLQEEKASIEMEARQYKRMIEEKSAYDDEEMNILEEILVRREKEKLFLEKEVEAYRQMVSDNNDGPLNDPDDDPMLYLRQLAASTEKNVTMENKCGDDDFESKFSPRHHDEHSNFTSGKMDLWKEILPTEKDVKSTTKDLKQVQEINQGDKLAEKVIRTCHGTDKGNPSLDPIPDKDPRVYDVHIIGDDTNLRNEASDNKDERLSFGSSLKLRETDCVVHSGTARERTNVITDASNASRETEFVSRKNIPEVTPCLPPISRRGSYQGLRRNSISAVDAEMVKIDTEIVQLRDRLKHVQEGRGKLGLSMECKESKSSQLRLLEDIAQQIQEIRRFTEPETGARQASLPPPNSKGLSKRRRSRSVSSSGFRMSSEG